MKLKIGDKFRLTDNAIENYGEQYRGKSFTVSSVATKYMPASEFYSRGKPKGFHPGYDGDSGEPLYDAKELNFSVYGWEIVPE